MKTIKVNNTTINFNEGGHIYTKENGDKVISVTAITGIIDKSPALMGWVAKMMGQYLIEKLDKGVIIDDGVIFMAKKEYRKISQQAMNYGTQIHKWIEQWIKGEKPDIPNDPMEVVNGIIAFLKWQKENKAKFIESEKMGYSRKYNFCGTIDAVAKIGNNRVIIDFKSSKAIYPDMFLQVCGYAIMYEEETGKKIDKVMIIKFDKETGEFEVAEMVDQKKARKTFLACLTVKKYLLNK